MDRRSFIKRSVATGAAAAATTFAAPAIAEGRIEWRLITSWPKNFPGLGTTAERLAQKITRMSGGRLTVKLYAADELVPAFGVFDAVQQGAAEAYHSAAYYYGGKHPALNFYTSVPFGMYAPEHMAWWLYGDGEKLQDELYAPFGIKAIPAANTSAQAAGWFAREITGPDDLKGLKFRTAGLNGELWREAGCNVVQLPGREMFQAFQSGMIDAAEWVGPWNDLAFGLHRLAKNYYTPGIGEGQGAVEIGIGRKHWDALPDDLKAVVREAAISEYQANVSEFLTRNASALKALQTEHGVTVRPFPETVNETLARAGETVMRRLREGGDDLLKKVWASYYGFRNDCMTWTRHAEQPYLNARAKGPTFTD
ncbi:TRAP transporter substrate-binding protein [Tistrella mobilis]|uniref:ABC transporter substrate-binding protein n=1 Tax=Tistrella mobilis TaxID=171437 RepID=A0A162L8P5_9PROT|nr:TRAP transporter substrate-binding protein [Tistrella mobilis]KYO53805.1 ABC transporter substrate-binding protein [Tistrella mobilis]